MVTANKTGQNITEEGPSLNLDVEKLRKSFYSGVLNLSLKKKKRKKMQRDAIYPKHKKHRAPSTPVLPVL